MNEITNIPSNTVATAASLPAGASVYFLGIGGIGMSALARFFNAKGMKVSGYDKTETPLTLQLVQEGIAVHYTDDIILANTKADLVIYTPAVPQDHKELNYFKKHNYNLQKRSEVLGSLTTESYSICVAGTHGKTTTSAMVAHLLQSSGYGGTAFLGGIASNYNSNLVGSGMKTCVVEADEYDRSFLQLSPNIAIITAMDADHLDIYGTEENMQEAFIAFTKKIEPGGLLLVKKDVKRTDELTADKKWTYHITDENADVFAHDIRVMEGAYFFNAQMPAGNIEDITLHMGGRHNIENMLAAIATAKYLGISDADIKEGVASFKGVKRRFETVLRTDNLVLIDDYAHHPEELRALIDGAKNLYPDWECTIIFQPHLFSRTKDHAAGFAEVLSQADETFLLPIYPARELPMEGVTSELIKKDMTNKSSVITKEALLNHFKNNSTNRKEKQLLIMAGAGDIDALVLPLKQLCEANIAS